MIFEMVYSIVIVFLEYIYILKDPRTTHRLKDCSILAVPESGDHGSPDPPGQVRQAAFPGGRQVYSSPGEKQLLRASLTKVFVFWKVPIFWQGPTL